MEKHRVIIVGAGFGGLRAAKLLARHPNIDLTVIDRRNYHLFQPLLYQVATAGLSPAEIAVPIRAELTHYPNAKVLLGNVIGIDLSAKTVATVEETLPYDFLILACGAKHSYFSNDHWEENAPGLKTLEQATEIRRRILLAFELAEKESNLEKQKQHLTFLIVGGGATGVELAGAISEISRHTLERDFRRIDPSRTRVILVEAGPRILPAFHPDLSKRATQDLENLGVQVWTNTRVNDISAEGVALGGDFIKATTVLWAAGVKPSSLTKLLDSETDKLGRVIVREDLTLPGYPEVFVIGDMACFQTPRGPLPGLAPVAIQQGEHAARLILKSGKGRTSFKYVDKGQMATIGRKKAIMESGRLRMGGVFAWMAWLFVHILYLVGFRNRLFVVLEWTWSYVSFRRGARLIVDKEWRSNPIKTMPRDR